MKRWLTRIAAAVAVLFVAAVIGGAGFALWFKCSVPDYDGMRAVAGIQAPVQILRDGHAVPHILAASFDDAAFALGYAHAQDRLWQMELSRRYVQGRLAELFGETALPNDILMRSFGLYAAAGDAVSHLSPATQRVLECYAAGVNAYLDHHAGPLPIEFTLAGDAPEPWRPADTVAVLKGMSMMLSGNAFGEAARVKLMSLLGKRGVQDFLAPFGAAPLPDYMGMIFGGTRLGDNFGIPDITASNDWVVDGAHSVTGKPLLANDPHLGFTIPSIWYLAHLAIPGEDMVGGTLAGVPAIIVGRNRHVAWGLTNTEPDTEDLYLERLNTDNPSQYQVPGGWASFDTHAETVKVRWGADRRIFLRATRHGPVMEDGPGSAFAGVAPRGYVLALAWTALAPDDTTLDAVLGINRAPDAQAFRTALSAFVSPMQNIVYADDQGHIGLALPGRVPIRAAQNDSLGLVPALGWDGRYDWQGYIPPGETASIVDPPSGRIATANNKTVPDSYPYTLTREWEPAYRHDRIDALLAATPLHSVESFKSIQLDTIDTYALALKSRLVAAAPFPASDGAAVAMVARWNGAMLRDRPEPLIFAAWTRALARRIYADELGPSFLRYWGYRPDFTLRVLDNQDGEARWCDDRATQGIEDCASRIRLALDDALAELRQAYGADPKAWRWGDPHKALLSGRPFGAFPVIGGFFNREIEMDGGPFTVLRADHQMASERPYGAIHGAGYRGIYDLANPDRSLYVVSTGESGNLYSPHYDDLTKLWAGGGYITIPITPASVIRGARNRLTLQPVSAVKLPNRPR